MGYLPHTGGLSKTPHLIVVDAVLTEQGRFRLAKGDFNITKFALGDDEIDYSLYDTAAATENQDDVIMLTPVLEAVPDAAVGIRHFLYTAPAPEGGFGIQPQLIVSPTTTTIFQESEGTLYAETINAVDPDFRYSLQFTDTIGTKCFNIVGEDIVYNADPGDLKKVWTLNSGAGGNTLNIRIKAQKLFKDPGTGAVLDYGVINTFSSTLEIRGNTTGVLGTVTVTWQSKPVPPQL